MLPALTLAQVTSYSNHQLLSVYAGAGHQYGGGPSYSNSQTSTFGVLKDSGGAIGYAGAIECATADVAASSSAKVLADTPDYLKVTGNFVQKSTCSSVPVQPYTTISNSIAQLEERLTFTIASDEFVALTITGTPGASWTGLGSVSEDVQFFSYNSYYGNWSPSTLTNLDINSKKIYSAFLHPGTYTIGFAASASALAGTNWNRGADILSSDLDFNFNYALEVGSAPPVPEPASMVVLAFGSIGVLFKRKRQS